MAREQNRIREVAEQLHGLGYPLVQTQVRVPSAVRLRVDVLAWAVNDEGAIVPSLAIEIQNGQRPEAALPLLAQVRAALGTVEHYILAEDRWFLAGRGLRMIQPADGPPTPRRHSEGQLKSLELVTELLQQRIWSNTKAGSDGNQNGSALSAFVDAVSVDSDRSTIETVHGDVVAVEPTVLWNARRAVLADIAERDRTTSQHVSRPGISSAISSLVGARLEGTVVDPFCGSGSFLWLLQERAVCEGRDIETIGRDIRQDVIHVASVIGQTAPTGITFEIGDAFADALPEADVIVTAPPMGVRLTTPHKLQNGTSTRQADVAAVDVSLRALKPGGRAVFQLAPGMTFQSVSEAYRDYLSHEYRVAALIGCPPGSAYGTMIQTVLMVVDKSPAGETFVAQLSEDWETQLAPNGPVMMAALSHIDGPGNGSR
ncbi:N-6 DNA methylase [Arthrobacter sp. zg-Y1116]|uniref:N-6 DNA methylase n=1 Tax=Arthrobacter sp. zg-Y1116 TaxID=2964611 RepID=UPI00210664C3|nr:N-6 DNA methylase [Arthrobacter sp. zg-Y1116]MCQ1947585.1 N-6 DNA methylase [Arthrobacter sp. zg-Y1116]